MRVKKHTIEETLDFIKNLKLDEIKYSFKYVADKCIDDKIYIIVEATKGKLKTETHFYVKTKEITIDVIGSNSIELFVIESIEFYEQGEFYFDGSIFSFLDDFHDIKENIKANGFNTDGVSNKLNSLTRVTDELLTELINFLN